MKQSASNIIEYLNNESTYLHVIQYRFVKKLFYRVVGADIESTSTDQLNIPYRNTLHMYTVFR